MTGDPELAFPPEVELSPPPVLQLVSAPLSPILSINYGQQKLRGEAMNWKHLLTYITGTVDQELLAVGNILKRYGIPPAPERKTTTTWKEFIRTYIDVLVATNFFTAEVWTTAGLVTCYVLFFIHLSSRQVHVAAVTPHPDERWMVQSARNITMIDWGFLFPGQYLIDDRDEKFRCRERLGGLLKYCECKAA
jgi:hypothetical protein